MHIGLMVLQMRLQDCAGNDQEGIVAKISRKGMALLYGVRENLMNWVKCLSLIRDGFRVS